MATEETGELHGHGQQTMDAGTELVEHHGNKYRKRDTHELQVTPNRKRFDWRTSFLTGSKIIHENRHEGI